MGVRALSENVLRFTVDSLLLGELGERLVTKNYIALAELIKNAYDADATQVTISFIKAKGGKRDNDSSEICIDDTGHGMTFEEIKNYWMRIATPHKLREPVSPIFGRKKTGSKGIGRFACRRLAKKLIMESIAINKNDNTLCEHTWIEFDWEKYIPGETLTDIPNEYKTKNISKSRTGFKLRLIGLNDSWLQREFNVLRRQVLGLSIASPTKRKGYREDPGFEIEFDAPEFDMGVGELSEQVMDAGWGRLKGEVSFDGTAVLKLDAMKIEYAEFEFPEKLLEIPGAVFDIAIIWRVKEYCRDPTTLTLGLIDDIFKQWSGVRVFLESFRVYPYGEPGDDWLEVDEITARRLTKIDDIFKRVADNLIGLKERRPLLSHPRNRNLLGKVMLSNFPENKFQVTMSREGFIENKSFIQLKEFIRAGLMWCTLYYANFLYLEDLRKLEEAYEELKYVIEEKEEVPIEVKTIPIINSALKVITETTKSVVKNLPKESQKIYKERTDAASIVVKESVHRMGRQITFLRTVASTGALMLVFSHESRELIGKLDTYAGNIERLTKDLKRRPRNEFIKLADSLRDTRDRFDKQVKLFGGITKGLSEIKRRKIRFSKIYKDVIDCYQTLKEDYNFIIEPDFEKNLMIGPILEAELYSILINLISNAVKVVIAGSGNKIKVTAYKSSEGSILRIYDDGIGLSKESREVVLTPLVADPEGRLYKALEEKMKYKDLISIGEGSGLGLSIVNDIVTSYGKKIRFIDPEEPWKTCVEVTLP